jgi:hypothetical protein
MGPKRYATAAAFRRALEDRLQDIAGKESVDLQRLRRQVAFDRLLARLFQAAQPRALPWVAEGWLRDGVEDQGCAHDEGY